MSKTVQAKNIDDAAVLDAVRAVRGRHGVPLQATTWDVVEHLPQYPAKVVCAKLGALVRRGLLRGSAYPTLTDRGDFEIADGAE